MKLEKDFYERPDVVQISRDLIGKILCTRMEGRFTSAMITETEAYCGRNDRACHANDELRTARTEVMYGPGGVAYVYLCYGIHHLFNVVTNREGLADAVLIRAVKPVEGNGIILDRRGRDTITPQISNGPGKLSQALGIQTLHSGTPLRGKLIWIEDRQVHISANQIESGPRIGIEYAGDHAKRPWRFYLKNSKWVSR
ncbi:MAG: DNA-3-methyladenine glycosylase [Balneolaceae bacterium]